MNKELVVVMAHIDDLEFSCLGYMLENRQKYDCIKLLICTSWPAKEGIFNQNLKEIEQKLKHEIQYVNLKLEQRSLVGHFDELKDKIYKNIKFDKNFDILTHDKADAHSDHKTIFEIMFGLYKYSDNFITVYSPSSVNYDPNYYIELSKNYYDFKHKLLTNYSFNEEQSYSGQGKYFRKEYTNVAAIYAMENFITKNMKYCEIYKIYKWS